MITILTIILLICSVIKLFIISNFVSKCNIEDINNNYNIPDNIFNALIKNILFFFTLESIAEVFCGLYILFN